ncbi:vacuolar protein sorting-associated protein 33A-like protein [Neoconidiobolus thromboides FSU 785]|nr:vacuolar protein sorting-associated protein 33A-like protein [Neoconidiobolus thromboides FSU 785]
MVATNQLFDVTKIKLNLKEELIRMLDSILGKKILILDPNLSGALSLVTEFTFLKERGVEKVLFLTNKQFDIEGDNLLYLTRANIQQLNLIAENILYFNSKNVNKEFHLYCAPSKNSLIEAYFEEKGVLGSLTQIESFKMDFIPLEEDLFSLENSNTFKELYLDGDFNCLSAVASALMKIQNEHGYFNRILGKGKYSKTLKEMLHRLRLEKEVEGESDIIPSNIINSVILLERNNDLITPLLTQLTYEGLLEENYGIKNTLIEVPIHISKMSNKKKKVALNNGDVIYKKLRDLNFANVGKTLNLEAKRLDEDYRKRHQAQSVKEIREFVSNLSNLQSEHSALRLHTSLAESLMELSSSEEFDKLLENEQSIILNNSIELVEDLIAQHAPLVKILRLIALQCQVNGGLGSKILSQYKKEICQNYGYHHLLTFENLSKVELIYELNPNNVRNKFSLIAKAFRLLVEEVDEQMPNDISYVYSGYAPLSIRLAYCGIGNLDKFNVGKLNSRSNTFNSIVSTFSSVGVNNGNTGMKTQNLGSGWAKFEDVLKVINGPTFDIVQKFNSGNKEEASITTSTSSPKIILIVFLAGCTSTEIAAIRYLSKVDEANFKFIILTTNIISGNSMLESIIEVGNPLLVN